MPMPFLRRFFPTRPVEGEAERLIDNEYQLERIAVTEADRSALDEYLQEFQAARQTLATATLQSLARQEAPSGPLTALYALQVAAQPGGTTAFIPVDIIARDRAGVADRLRERGAAIVEILQKNQPLPSGSADSAAAPDLQAEAARALTNGMTSTGRDQQEEFKDALRLFQEAQEGAIGNRNYVIWFQIGWILWKQGATLTEAEEAFYQAYRLSGTASDTLHYLSLRHRAYLQYRQGKATEALATLEKATTIWPDDPDTLLDAARYAAAAGQSDSALGFLKTLLDREPSHALTLFADPEFSSIAPVVAAFLIAHSQVGEQIAVQSVAHLSIADAAIRAAQERTGVTIPLSESLTAAIAEIATVLLKHTGTIHYPVAIGNAQAANAMARSLYTQARDTLAAESAAIEQRLLRPRRQIERVFNEQKRWREDIVRMERSARQMNFNLSAPPRRGLFGRVNPDQDTLYSTYQYARTQEAAAATMIAEEVPGYEADIARGEAEQKRIAETIVWLTTEEAK